MAIKTMKEIFKELDKRAIIEEPKNSACNHEFEEFLIKKNNKIKISDDYNSEKTLEKFKNEYIQSLKNKRDTLNSLLLTSLFGVFLISFAVKVDFVLYTSLTGLAFIFNLYGFYLSSQRIGHDDYGYNEIDFRELMSFVLHRRK